MPDTDPAPLPCSKATAPPAALSAPLSAALPLAASAAVAMAVAAARTQAATSSPVPAAVPAAGMVPMGIVPALACHHATIFELEDLETLAATEVG